MIIEAKLKGLLLKILGILESIDRRVVKLESKYNKEVINDSGI